MWWRHGRRGVLSDALGQKFNREAFAERLRNCLPKDDRLQESADSIGISLSGLKNWLRGTSEPDVSHLVQIVKYTGVSLAWLVLGEGEMQGGTDALDGPGYNKKAMLIAIESMVRADRKLEIKMKPRVLAKESLNMYGDSLQALLEDDTELTVPDKKEINDKP